MGIYEIFAKAVLVIAFLVVGVVMIVGITPTLINGSFLMMALTPFVWAVYIVVGVYLKKFISKKG